MFRVPMGRDYVEFELPATMRGAQVDAALLPPLPDAGGAIESALDEPLGAPSLVELAHGRRDAVVTVTDATRACPDHLLVPPMLRRLEAAGLGPDAVTILVAVGTHRASTRAEKVEKLGADVVARYRVVDHDASDHDNLVTVGAVAGGPPFTINRLAYEADLLIATGLVEPHQYAGYSGGAKTASIGTAGEEIIQYTHGPAFLDDPGTRLGKLVGNRFQEVVREVGRSIGLDFVINAVLDGDGRMVSVASGAPGPVHDHLADVAARLYTVSIPHQFDIAVAGVGYPKDANLYQASRAASYLQFAPTPVVRPGGVIVLPATCPEGPGQGVGEQRFARAMAEATNPQELIDRVRREGLRAGEQRAYVMAAVLAGCTVIVAGAENPEGFVEMGFEVEPDITAALDRAAAIVGRGASVLVVPHALLTLPVVHAVAAAAP